MSPPVDTIVAQRSRKSKRKNKKTAPAQPRSRGSRAARRPADTRPVRPQRRPRPFSSIAKRSEPPSPLRSCFHEFPFFLCPDSTSKPLCLKGRAAGAPYAFLSCLCFLIYACLSKLPLRHAGGAAPGWSRRPERALRMLRAGPGAERPKGAERLLLTLFGGCCTLRYFLGRSGWAGARGPDAPR